MTHVHGNCPGWRKGGRGYVRVAKMMGEMGLFLVLRVHGVYMYVVYI